MGIQKKEHSVSIPTIFTERFDVHKVACGSEHTLALTKTGQVFQWGLIYRSTKKGEPSKSGTVLRPKFVKSLGSKVVVDIAAGTGQNLAIVEDRSLFSWGTGCNGELGLGEKDLGNFENAQKVQI